MKWSFIEPSVWRAAKKSYGISKEEWRYAKKKYRPKISTEKYRNAAKAATVIGLCAVGSKKWARKLPKRKKWF